MGKTQVLTFGCRLNAFESQLMQTHAEAAGLDDAIIVNSCAVTAEAERQLRQSLRKLRRKNPESRIILTGCAAQISPERYAIMDEVDMILGNNEKLRPDAFHKENLPPPGKKKTRVDDIMTVEETTPHMVDGFDGRSRAFLQVQNGCDHRCTFCIIPFGRGNSRSLPVETVITQAQRLAESGFREMVLTGVDLTAWGGDFTDPMGLGDLVETLLARIPALERLRLSSLDPVEIDPLLAELLASEKRLMPHLHLSLQAGDNLILKRMKRRHSREDAIAFCAEMRRRRPDMAFGADLIAGFPTEDEAMFENTLDLIEACDLIYLHVFPFSPRPGTPAASMPQVPAPVRKARAARLRAAGERALTTALTRRIGEKTSLLVEKEGIGRTEHYATALIDPAFTPGNVVPVEITGLTRTATGPAFLTRALGKPPAAA